MMHDGMRIDFYRRRLDELYQRAGLKRAYSKEPVICNQCGALLEIKPAHYEVAHYVSIQSGLEWPLCFDCAHEEVVASLKPHEAHLLEAFRQMEVVQQLIDPVLEVMNAPGVDDWDLMDRPNAAELNQIERANSKAEDLAIAAQEVNDQLFKYWSACKELAENAKPYETAEQAEQRKLDQDPDYWRERA